jgi:hypothetical protein
VKSLTNEEKRRLFRERFDILLDRYGVPRLPEWFAPPWPEDSAMASWIDSEHGRCMRVEQTEPGDLEIDFFFAPAGANSELVNLFFRASEVQDRAGLVLEIYRLWFFDRLPAGRLDALLEELLGMGKKGGPPPR